MNRFKLVLAAVLCGLIFTGSAFAQGRRGGGPGGPGGGFGARSPFDTYVAALADANLAPDFTLTADVKTKIQAVRDDWKKAEADFATANKEELDKARQAMRDAAGDQDARQTAMQAMQAINAKGPKADEYVAKIKALLTPEQVTAVDTKAKEMQPQGGPGGRGGMGGGGAGGPPPQN